MTPQERKKRLKALGYEMVRNYFCPIRAREMPFATRPTNGHSGPTCVFFRTFEIDEYIESVEKIRRWQSE